MSLRLLMLVMLGGALGAALRYLIAHFSLMQFGPRFPCGTFIVNTLGAFAAGYLLVWLQGRDDAETWRALLMVGLLGGMTTYSALMIECLVLQRDARAPMALSYLMLTLVAGLIAVWLGARLAAPPLALR